MSVNEIVIKQGEIHCIISGLNDFFFFFNAFHAFSERQPRFEHTYQIAPFVISRCQGIGHSNVHLENGQFLHHSLSEAATVRSKLSQK